MNIIVIIATHNRSFFLRNRALASVFKQTRYPDSVIIVDDSDNPSEYQLNSDVVESFKRIIQSNVVHLFTKGSQGAAYSWNIAVESIMDECENPDNVFLAFLDDDDAWDERYLAECENVANRCNCDMVASHFYRVENDNKIYSESPISLVANDFLVGNPGIQGSNIFIRLSKFLEAGCFNENLTSCTDRDLCIRLADMGTVRYQSIAMPLMYHYAENNRKRLSTPNSAEKNLGLEQFWLKYSKRMSDTQRGNFLRRAEELFDWKPVGISEHALSSLADAEDCNPYELWIGVICSAYSVIRPLLENIGNLQHMKFIKTLKLILLENQLCNQDKLDILLLCKKMSIDVVFITDEMQESWRARGLFSNFYKESGKMLSIAYARTMLQKYMGDNVPADVICWILDEDMRFTHKTITALKYIPAVKKEGIDILIGGFEYSSPNPPINGIRVQLTDLLANLQWITTNNNAKPLEDLSQENLAFITKYPDYYYDLSRKHRGHLEHPYWISPIEKNETYGSVMNRMLDNAWKIFFGNPLTRPIIAKEPLHFMESIRDSVNRGGNTIIFNHKALTDSPNLAFQIKGVDVRRSDMIWSIINRYYRKMSVKAGNISTWHAGKADLGRQKIDVQKIRDEIIGSAFYAALTDFLQNNQENSLDFTNEDLDHIVGGIEFHIKNRIKKLRLTFFRAKGITASLKSLPIYSKESRLQDFVEIVENWFSKSSFCLIERECFSFKPEDVKNFLLNIRKAMSTQSGANEIKFSQ